MRSIPSLLLFGLLATSSAAQAQSPMVTLRDQVTQMQDTARLRELERQHVAGASATDQITAGFAALRLWELTEERAHARRSRRHFDTAAKTEPDNAWAHYGHALSLEAEIRRGAGTLVTDDALSRALGYDPVSRGRRALERALALDPTLPGAADLLTKYAVETRDDTALRQSHEVFERALAEGRDNDEVLLGLTTVTRELGEYERSAEVAAMLAERATSNAALAHLELAMSLASVAGRLDDAAAAYAEALRLAEREMLEHLWQDANILTRTREDVDWKYAKSDEQRRAMLTTMWEIRGALGDMSGMQRAAEHYRRMNVAWLRHRRSGQSGAPPLNGLRFEKIDPRYQDTGVIYIRHGAPDDVYASPALGAYLVWFYRDDDGSPLSYHFMRSKDAGWSQDYILMRDLPCPMDPGVAMRDRRLYPLTRPPCSMQKVRPLSLRFARDAENALNTDTHRPSLERQIPFHFDWYTFRGENGMTDVVAAIGVPLDQLPTQAMPLRLALSVVDTVAATVARTSVATPAPVADDGVLMRTHVALQVAPSRTTAYRVGIREAGNERVGMTYGGPIIVPNYSFRDVMMISDVVLAEPRVSGTFQRGQHRLSLAPTQVFAGGVFRAYYEIYNLAPGTPYRTELRVRPAERSALSALLGRDGGVTLEFEDVVPDGAEMVRELRDIEAPFAAGEYIITVTVRAEGHRPMTKERRFTIDER